MIEVVSKATGLTVDKFDKTLLLEGATERDIVYAGLDEIMSAATEEVIKTSLNRRVDLRTAAFVTAINKLDEFYSISGIS